MGKPTVFLGLFFLLVGAAALSVAVIGDLDVEVLEALGISCPRASCPGLGLGAVIFGGIFAATGAWLVWFGIPAGRGGPTKTGLAGKATVLKAENTGLEVNASPWIDFTLQVEVEGHPPHQRQVRAVVNRGALGSLLPGSIIPVTVDPVDPGRVTIDWDHL